MTFPLLAVVVVSVVCYFWFQQPVSLSEKNLQNYSFKSNQAQQLHETRFLTCQKIVS